MTVYAHGKKFMATVGSGKDRERKTLETEELALAWEATQLALRAAAVPAPIAAPKNLTWTLQKAVDHTIKHRWKGKGGEAKAVINSAFALDFFGSETLISAITSKWVIEYMEELMEEHDNSPSTLNKKMSALKVVLTMALDIGGIDTLPRMKRYTEATRSPHWFSDGDEDAMLRGCERLGYTELGEFIQVGLDTGFRRGEILNLKVGDLHKGNLLIHADATKGKTARAVPATDRVKAIVASKQGQFKLFTLTASNVRKQWTELRAALGRTEDPFWIPHTMRHTCATRLVSEGVSLKAVQMWLGHGVIESTMVYAHLAPGQLTEAGSKLQSRIREL